MNEFKEILKYLRNREHLTQMDLAGKLGISSSAIGNYENGSRKPNREIEEAIADFFNVSLDFLHGIDEERKIVTDDEYDLILAFRNADDLDKSMVRRILGIREKKDITIQKKA